MEGHNEDKVLHKSGDKAKQTLIKSCRILGMTYKTPWAKNIVAILSYVSISTSKI